MIVLHIDGVRCRQHQCEHHTPGGIKPLLHGSTILEERCEQHSYALLKQQVANQWLINVQGITKKQYGVNLSCGHCSVKK